MTTNLVLFEIPEHQRDQIVPELIRAIGPKWKPYFFRAYFFGKKIRKSGVSGTCFDWHWEKFNGPARSRVLNAFPDRGGNGVVGNGYWFTRKWKTSTKWVFRESIWLRFDVQPYDIGFCWTIEKGGSIEPFDSLIKLCERLGCNRKKDQVWKN